MIRNQREFPLNSFLKLNDLLLLLPIHLHPNLLMFLVKGRTNDLHLTILDPTPLNVLKLLHLVLLGM
jgi:hypothetical protein